MKRNLFRLFCLLFFAHTLYLKAETPYTFNKKIFPRIEELRSTDIMFKQQQGACNANEKLLAAEKYDEIIIEFYLYVPQKSDDLLYLSAHTNLNYDTIATLNRIQSVQENLTGKELIIPSAKGLFIAEKPESNLEIMIYQENKNFLIENEIPCYNICGRKYFFISGGKLTPTQRAYFLDSSFQLPLDKIVITSGFGFRNSPVYKTWKFHKGIDLAAEEGTPVYACKAGTVSTILANDPVFGNCIILSHNNGFASVYAHLSKISVKKDKFVNAGTIIGHVGQTGLATGPHLHFEIRQNGTATDPAVILEGSK